MIEIINKNIKKEMEYQKVYTYLEKYDKNFFVFQDYERNELVKVNKTIWIFWLQGLESAPELVRKCIQSVRTYKPNDFDLVILTENNLNEYIMMPDYIREKYKDGNFTTTHFSDLLRLELLYMYGGCWIDATVYCSEKIPTYMLESQFFMFKTSVVSTSVLKGSSWWICARKGENIIKETRTLLYNYWKDEIKLRNYFTLHIAMARVINESSFNRATYNNAYSVCNSDPHILWGVMGKEFDEDAWLIVKSNSKIHKLSYKRRFIRGDIYNFYEALIDGALQ